MCGINGIVRLRPDAPPIDPEELLRTRDAMALRGPDGAGAWTAPDGRAALASRRLAILDLSPAGAQPMSTPDGRWHLVMNGEIYNFRALRRELEERGATFRSQSDTEVVLTLLARHGAAALSRLRGMFGLALWDDAGKRLLLARDPLGIKPLYYSDEGGCLRFASQVKALEAGGAVSRAVDPAGLAGFLLWGAVPDPLTIRSSVRALPAGCSLEIEDGRTGEPKSFYRPDGVPAGAPLDPAAAVEDSVAAHLVSDVPVAVFLSAGLDSGLIAALARRRLPEPPVTFTLTFDVLAGTPRDEGPLAAQVAGALGTRHVERRVGRADFAGLWPAALAAMDQPSIDGFNTFVVSRAAHEAGLKVVLSGLGGDEVFGSYPSFRDVPAMERASRRAGRLPGLAAAWPALARLAADRPKLPGLLRYGRSRAGAYFLRRGLFLPEELPALLGRETAEEGLRRCDPVGLAAGVLRPGGDPWVDVHRLETALYMRHQLLRDADWASMAWSVELRVPLADAWLRAHLAAAGFEPARSQGKAAFVRQAAPELPAELFARPKRGFYIPVMEWLDPETARLRAGDRSRRLALKVLEGAWPTPN
ncbi:MAG TPA: asparagine synthase (glutamine-hydrolyzing) [Thermoanaerobaculia bacterium]|nr:asparagine synthase (glutamine-hydrolyzing) [Thermoanaerobaculia bacterium]